MKLSHKTHIKIALLLVVFLLPGAALAAGDHISIGSIAPQCGTQELPISVSAQYGDNNRHLVTYLDGVQIDHYNNEPTSVTETVTVGEGTHTFRARIYLIEWDATHFSIQLANRSKTFTINACDENPGGGDGDEDPGEDEEPPVDEEPGDDETPSTDDETPTETTSPSSNSGSSGTTINARLCFLSGRTVCVPHGLETKEMIPYMVKLADLFYEWNQMQF